MINEHGIKAIDGVGYCLGAEYVCRFMAKNRGFIAGFIAHPSATSDDEVKGVAGSIGIAAAGMLCNHGETRLWSNKWLTNVRNGCTLRSIEATRNRRNS